MGVEVEAVADGEGSPIPTLLPWVIAVGNREREEVHMND